MADLFSPVRLGDIALSNRMVMAPLTRNRSSQEGVPNDLNVTYYEQRASAGLIITEATPISPMAHGYPLLPGIYNDAQVAGWKKVTDAVHAKGGIKGMTQDISATGMFLELDADQKPGSIISFWVELDTPGAKMKLVCEAEVVRVEQADGKIKVGTKIISQELQALTE